MEPELGCWEVQMEEEWMIHHGSGERQNFVQRQGTPHDEGKEEAGRGRDVQLPHEAVARLEASSWSWTKSLEAKI